MRYVYLGNHNATHSPFDGDARAQLMASNGPVPNGERLEGQRITIVRVEDDASLIDTFADITKRAGTWHAHSWTENDERTGDVLCDPPAWIETDVPGLAELLHAQYGSPIGMPDDVEETHWTDAGPPGIGPDGAIPGTPGGDAAIADEKAHAQWKLDVIAMHEYTAADESKTEQQRIDAARQVEVRKRELESDDEPTKKTARGNVGKGFGGLLMLTLAIAFYALSRVMLRTDAGKDFQSKVMGDTASTGTGAYAAANYIGITENTGAPAAGDTTLTGELTASGLGRAQGTWAHTTGAASYTVTKTFTSSDVTVRTVHKAALFNASSSGTMPFESALPSDAIIVSGDTLTITWTISI